MSTSDELKNTVENLIAEVKIDEAIEVLRQAHECGEKITLQVGKSVVNIGQGKDIHIGDRTYITWNDEAAQAFMEFFHKLQSTTQTPTPQLASVDKLVQQVRSNLHDDIQRLHGTMPLWGVDRWVPLGDLFVDVNILEELSSSRSRFERFDCVEVADFNELQVRSFAQHWFKAVMANESAVLAKVQEFLRLLFLKENKPIRELAITPILLSLTCAVFHQTGKFHS